MKQTGSCARCFLMKRKTRIGDGKYIRKALITPLTEIGERKTVY